MKREPTYEELNLRVEVLEKTLAQFRAAEEKPKEARRHKGIEAIQFRKAVSFEDCIEHRVTSTG